MHINYKRVKMAPPLLGTIRTDAISLNGLIKDKANELIELAKACNSESINNKLSILEGKWLLEKQQDTIIWQEPVDIFENPSECIKQLNNMLLATRRYRCKDSLIKLLNITKEFYDSLVLPQNKDSLKDIANIAGIDLLEYCIGLFKLTSRPFIVDMIEKIHQNMFDYAGFIQNLPVIGASSPDIPSDAPSNKPNRLYYQQRHERAYGQSIAQGVKSAALNYTCTGLVRDVDSVLRGIKLLEKYHGTIDGSFTAADYLSGRCPNIPTNIKAACNYFIALKELFCVSDDLSVANIMETMAVNLLPAYVNNNKIQIMQCTNQCNINKKARPWPYAKIKTAQFMDPCEYPEEIEWLIDAFTVFKQSLWMKKGHNGLALIFPFASTVLHHVDGKPVQITVEGNYPYSGEIELKILATEPVNFPIYIRIPGFTTGASVAVNKEAAQPVVSDSYYVLSRKFKSGDVIKLNFPLSIKIKRFYRRSCAVFKGPVIMAYPQDEKAKLYSNFALDTQSSPSYIENSNNILADVFEYEGEFDNNSKIALMPDCDIENHINIEMVPYATIIGRLAQFATVNLDEAKAALEDKMI